MATTSKKSYKQRLIDPYLDELLTQLPALLMTGPRTCGKSTTLSRRAKTVIRLDRENEAQSFMADPDAALRNLPEPILLDEWQNVPGVLGAVRRAVETSNSPNRFYVTGSIKAELENQTWPGTGRITRVAMHPMTIGEQLEIEGTSFFDKIVSGETLTMPNELPDLREYVQIALRSGFPDAALNYTGAAHQAWLESYIADLFTHDIEQLEEMTTRRRDPLLLSRYFEAYALNSAGVTDHKSIYDKAGISKVTAHVYEQLLNDLLITDQVPAWTTNRGKRLVHSPKRYLIDAALIATTLRLDEHGILKDGNILGRLLDTFVYSQLRPQLELSKHRPRLYHLRTAQGRQEIDLICELAGQRLVGIEIKASSAPTLRDAQHLRWMCQEFEERFVVGIVLHTGPRQYELADKIMAVPIAALWGP